MESVYRIPYICRNRDCNKYLSNNYIEILASQVMLRSPVIGTILVYNVLSIKTYLDCCILQKSQELLRSPGPHSRVYRYRDRYANMTRHEDDYYLYTPYLGITWE
jgi:hypothetical protein